MVLVAETKKENKEFYFAIYLKGGKFAKISTIDFPEVSKYTWYLKKSFCRKYVYRCYRINGKKRYQSLHRFIMLPPSGYVVHHINKDVLDNRRSNLLSMPIFDHIKKHSWR